MSSSTVFPGLQSPAAGFDQPFEMLGACHDRVRRSLALLQRLVQHVQAHGVDGQARDAARDVLRYFNVAAPHHHEDEERHVIPLLMASDDAHARAAAHRMLDDHAHIRERWTLLRPLLDEVAEGATAMPERLPQAAAAFVDVHREHLVLEDECAFPEAHAALRAVGEQAVAAMGEEMAARRGVTRR